MERNRATSGKNMGGTLAKSFLAAVLAKQHPDMAFISPAQALMLSMLLIGRASSSRGISSILTHRRHLKV
ncbi:hypothetical protein SPF06_09285 [Sinomonas sp. JGH33]|uniref:Serpin domain-containing protein n=1 Tax=Sinomonas terricola TaxID=3110330 RepID=A0ABU5T713_9MICC|nr:hypothetical protein [Sinomonas sp. JGH33]MEA5454911.1 hypothetical protein [Sinomonas sp. JGH33]